MKNFLNKHFVTLYKYFYNFKSNLLLLSILSFVFLLISIVTKLYLISNFFIIIGLIIPAILLIIGIFVNPIISLYLSIKEKNPIEFLIKKGEHYSNQKLYKFLKNYDITNNVNYWVKFDKNNEYHPNINQLNKLFGVSFDWHHHNNSARYTFRDSKTDSNKVEIHSYVYIDGKRKSKKLIEINKGEYYFMHLFYGYDKIIYIIKDETDKIILRKEDKIEGRMIKPVYFLFPYYGGQIKSPNDFKIYLSKFKNFN
jgi:hypothetical protein